MLFQFLEQKPRSAVTIDIHDDDLTRGSSAYLIDLNTHSTPLTETWGLCQRSEEAGFGVQYSTETDNFQVSATKKVSMPGMFINQQYKFSSNTIFKS